MGGAVDVDADAIAVDGGQAADNRGNPRIADSSTVMGRRLVCRQMAGGKDLQGCSAVPQPVTVRFSQPGSKTASPSPIQVQST